MMHWPTWTKANMKSGTPKISIITVCFNAGDKLEKTVLSVISQTYSNIEYIIIDGGSTDNTSLIARKFKENIALFISEPDNGIYNAMNKGIQNAAGELIIFLNAGDFYLTPHVIEYSIAKLNLSSADLFFGRIIWEDPKAKNIALSDHEFVRYEWDIKYSNFPQPATIYKKKLFGKLGLFDESFKILADYEWNLRALVKYRIAFQYLDIVFALFRADGISNITASTVIVQNESEIMFNNYFKSTRIFSFVEKYVGYSNRNRIKEKILAKLYHKKLNRIY